MYIVVSKSPMPSTILHPQFLAGGDHMLCTIPGPQCLASGQDPGAGLVETLLMLTGGGAMSGQPGQQPPSGES